MAREDAIGIGAEQHHWLCCTTQDWDRWDGRCACPDLFTKGCSVFTRPAVPDQTSAMRGAAPLPPNAAWVVTFDRFGSHASVGVATAKAELAMNEYGMWLCACTYSSQNCSRDPD